MFISSSSYYYGMTQNIRTNRKTQVHEFLTAEGVVFPKVAEGELIN
jgi:hypothetical protein